MSQDRAIEIAKGEIDFEPTAVQVRNVPRGIQGERAWIVSLYTGKPTNPGRCRLVEIDADSGRVASVSKC